MTFTKLDALISLRPGAEFTYRDNEKVLEWHKNATNGDTQPSDSEIDAEVTRLNNAKGYIAKRVAAYPSAKDQLDLLYWDKKNGTNKWVEAVDKVKSDNPKP